MASHRRYELGVGLLLAAALVVLAWMALQVGALASLGPRVQVEAAFHDAAGLTPGAVVSVAGVQVGTVRGLRVEHDQAIVSLDLDPSAGIRNDAQVMIRARSVLGEKYVEVIPRSVEAPLVEAGDRLEVAGRQVEIDEMVNLMAPLVGALDPKTLNELGAALAKAFQEDPERLGRMIASADTALANVAEASNELPALVREGRATLADARLVVARANQSLSSVDAAIEQLDPLLTDARGVMGDARAATGPLPATVDDLRATAADARAAAARLGGTLDQADVVLGNLSEIDTLELRRMLREEGILVRLRPRQVDPEPSGEWSPQGQVKPR